MQEVLSIYKMPVSQFWFKTLVQKLYWFKNRIVLCSLVLTDMPRSFCRLIFAICFARMPKNKLEKFLIRRGPWLYSRLLHTKFSSRLPSIIIRKMVEQNFEFDSWPWCESTTLILCITFSHIWEAARVGSFRCLWPKSSRPQNRQNRLHFPQRHSHSIYTKYSLISRSD
jgi:hypothetical protein